MKVLKYKDDEKNIVSKYYNEKGEEVDSILADTIEHSEDNQDTMTRRSLN